MKAIISIPSKTIKLISEYSGIPIFTRRNQPRSLSGWFEEGTLIRWGTRRVGPMANTVINHPQAIKMASNKLLCRRILKRAGIPVPQEGTNMYPCIGRPRNHYGGRGFWMCWSDEDVKCAKRGGAYYFSELYPKQNEYRVHIGSGKVILFSEKTGNKSNNIIWNHDKTGFTFIHIPRGERRKSVIELAKKAIDAVGLDFGCVDIGADPKYGDYPKAVVFEINTAPALSDYGIKCYARHLNSL